MQSEYSASGKQAPTWSAKTNPRRPSPRDGLVEEVPLLLLRLFGIRRLYAAFEEFDPIPQLKATAKSGEFLQAHLAGLLVMSVGLEELHEFSRGPCRIQVAAVEKQRLDRSLR
jgi:hypothetical protein